MHRENIVVSIIVVHYKVKNVLFCCLQNLEKLLEKVNTKCEVIVVDNDENKTIDNEIKRNFPFVIYIKSPNNKGYGGGNNLGASQAKGEFLFFLNPDTILLEKAIDSLVNFFNQNSKVGVVAPLLLDNEKNVYKLQGAGDLTFLSAIFSMSFIGKLFPSNPIAKAYWNLGWDKKEVREVRVVPGTAFMVRRTIFEKIGGFDENFFLFFEEFDICKRIRDAGYHIYMLPKANVIHFWGESTKYRKDKDKIFVQSRFYYFKKHFGLTKALLVEAFARFNKEIVALLFILLLGLFLRVYKLSELMTFIGDQGWFYLSARDMILTGKIPLVGIPSSHPWLHQGPLWTYMLALVLWIFRFNPLSGAYFTSALGVVTVWLLYKVSSEFFSKRVALISSLLYATSPLVVFHARMPYHTNPIPLFTLLFIYSLYKWIKGEINYFPLTIFFLAILYNLELATVSLGPMLLIILGFGLWRKRKWATRLFNKKLLAFSLLAFVIPMVPIILYDIQNGFPQTIKFSFWIGYRILRVFGYPSIHQSTVEENIPFFISQSIIYLQQLIFSPSFLISLFIITLSIAALIREIILLYKKKQHNYGYIILSLWTITGVLGYIVNKTPSEAYLPVLFPAFVFLIAIFFDKIYQVRQLVIPTSIVLILITFLNTFTLISQFNSMRKDNRLSFKEKLSVAKTIVSRAEKRDYNLIGSGPGSEFESFTMNYEYLTWWLGHAPSKKNKKLKFVITENKDGIKLEEFFINNKP